MNKNGYVILLTGTIEPNNIFSLKRNNVSDRENDYFIAINKWLQHNIPLVFCENSNFQSKKINSIKNPNFEFIQYKETANLSEKGKGFGELQIIKYALKNSKTLSDSDFVIKITGRLYFNKFNKIMKSVYNHDMFVMAPLELDLAWSDSRFFIFHKSFFYDYLIKYGKHINDKKGYCFEKALACAIHASIADQKKWEMLPIYPRYRGFSGTKNVKYNLLYNLSFIKVFKFPLFRKLCKI